MNLQPAHMSGTNRHQIQARPYSNPSAISINPDPLHPDRIIREMNPSDLEKTLDMCRLADPYSHPDQIRTWALDFLKRHPSYQLVCEHNRMPYGIIMGQIDPRTTHPYVEFFSVAPAAQGNGVGKRLLNALEDRFAADGHRYAELILFRDLDAALAVYDKCGWVVKREETSNGFNNPDVPAGISYFVLGKDLGK